MKFLIVFGSTEGQTRKISQRARDLLAEQSHSVDLIDSENPDIHPDWDSYDGVIIAGSVHQERHQESLSNFVLAHTKQLEGRQTALISVSLAAATEDGLANAQRYVDRFKSATGFAPNHQLLLAGALRYSKYDYFKVEIVKHVVMKAAGNFEPTGEHEFTDWDALATFIDGFAAHLAKTKA